MPSKRKLRRLDTYGYDGVRARDFRHTHDGPEVAPHKKKRRGKDAPCKRSPDKLHSYKYVPRMIYIGTRTFDWGETKCIHCGKRR